MNESEVGKALELQKKGYQLLRWVRDRVDRSTVSFTVAHDALSLPEAAHDWLRSNYSVIPVRCRPERADLRAFANIVASFLATSFDLVPVPGRRKITGCGCWCSWCSAMVSGSHLQAKKVTQRDKKRAHALRVEAVLQRALDKGLGTSSEAAKEIADRPDLAEESAILAYTAELVRRMNGHFEGPAVLALWRRFAWSRTGSPKKDYRLTTQAVLKAANRIDQALAE
jgi:hypothetical protein